MAALAVIDKQQKMRIKDINRSRVASAMVRGYFHAFFSGQADALFTGKKKLEAKEYKQLVMDNLDRLSHHFVSVLFPILIRLNYQNVEEVTGDMRKRHFSDSTPTKVLLRYACASKPLYDLITSEYQRHMYALLEGHLQSAEAYFSDCPPLTDEDSVPVSLAIRSLVRVQMQAYAAGITLAAAENGRLRQTTVYRLMLSGMVSLLHETPLTFEEENLELMFRKAALNSDNFETLMNEMNQAYEDLI
ncbi:hypothetical protein HMPREF9141_0961 [Prevotella multiformis DSM 16608]|uniref:Uncharacterized protein n=2 Tax=Prevotella multiformis TaxID=282402 RepID=F0F5U5_9BACT|nr:hypothetical protein HMPREF9141_0961 [Prevotella multiformis DSM 16608]